MKRRTKIIATVGPACEPEDIFVRLCEAGVDLFRLNFSHGNLPEKEKWITTIKKYSKQNPIKPIAILADLQGPKIRTGIVKPGGIVLETGKLVTLTTDNIIGTPEKIPVNYSHLPQDVKTGSRLLIDDGSLELKVLHTRGNEIECEILQGGHLHNNKGINLPDTSISTPSLTEKDLEDLDFCIKHDIDFIALSFVRKAQDIKDLKKLLQEKKSPIQVIAKIERPEAVHDFKKILAAADGIMVARGDLGVEMSPEKVPVIQKQIIRDCNNVGKPVITATQMLESMVSSPRPTRAETSDVANAILDGSDALMLSGETAKGDYPVKAVEVMHRVALDVERNTILPKAAGLPVKKAGKPIVSETIAQAACSAAYELNASAILAFTQTGMTATLVAKYRPDVPIIAVTPFESVQRHLAIYRGVYSFLCEIAGSTENQIDSVDTAVLASGILRKGDLVIITMGSPISTPGTTNLLKAHRLGT